MLSRLLLDCLRCCVCVLTFADSLYSCDCLAACVLFVAADVNAADDDAGVLLTIITPLGTCGLPTLAPAATIVTGSMR